MKRTLFTAIGLALALGATPVFTAEAKVSQDKLDHIMSAWPAEIRENAQKLVAQYGLPDRVTSTVLVWDVPNAAQQQAMIRTVGGSRLTAEAGPEMISLRK